MSSSSNKDKENVRVANAKLSSIFRDDPANFDNSLGILDLSKISDSLDGKTSDVAKKPEISMRLMEERRKALHVLNRAVNKSTLTPETPKTKALKPQSPRTPIMNLTDYVSYKQYDSINISDLVADKTIEVKSVSSPVVSSTKISFEPSEMSGRSTMCGGISRTPTIEEILSTSISKNVRNLCESLRESYSGGSSLPRTADMSLTSSGSSAFSNCRRANETGFSSEDFVPGENIESKLAADEISWEKEFAAIPPDAMNNSKLSQNNSTFSPPSHDSDVSLGGYFIKRSENLLEMIPQKSPTKTETYALVDDMMTPNTSKGSFSNFTIPERDTDDIQPVNAETFRKSLLTHTSIAATSNRSGATQVENNDESYILSVSAIANALNSIDTPEAGKGILSRLLKTKQIKTYLDATGEPLTEITGRLNKSLSLKPSTENSVKEITIQFENKENVNPTTELSDTATFTDSVLNCSDLKQLQDCAPKITSKQENNTPKDIPVIQVFPPHGNFSTQMENSKNCVPSKTNRKRSHSSTRAEDFERPSSKTPTRRSKSPNKLDELLAASGSMKDSKRKSNSFERQMSPDSSTHSVGTPKRSSTKLQLSPTSSSDRRYLFDVKSPGDSGKYSLPGYGLASTIRSRSLSPISGHLKTRSPSECSSSSEFSHKDGKLPLKATCQELSWGSIKLRSNTTKTLQIKNTANKRLVLRIEISGAGFQISNLFEQGNRLTMQPQECRTIVLNFCPTVMGAAAGKLSFYPPFEDVSPASYISLFGYGGHASVRPQNVIKGPVGPPFLTMGELTQLTRPLEKTFTLYNKGVLPAFASIIIESPDVDHPRICDCIEIVPRKTLIPPEGSRDIKVILKPRREDLRRIVRKLAPVMTIAKLKIVCGDEPTRQRIRNLIRRMNEIQFNSGSSSAIKELWNPFPNENIIPELMLLREQSTVAMDLMSTLKTHDILITLDHTSLDDTTNSSIVFSDMDETIMFKTMTAETSFMENAAMPVNSGNQEQLYVYPKSLDIYLADRNRKAILTLRSTYSTEQFYEIQTNYRKAIIFTPTEGQLQPGQEAQIIVDFKQIESVPSDPINIHIYLEKDRITIPVNVRRDALRMNKF